MDCNLSQLLLTLGRADRGTDDQAALDRHLVGCPACSAFASQFTAFDTAISRVMADVAVPDHLRETLQKNAAAWRGAQWRRTAYRYSALAAGVVVAVGLILGGMWRLRPVLDASSVARVAEQDWEARDSALHDWLLKNDLPTDFPIEFEFDLRTYVYHGKGELAGVDVPVILFQNGTEQARLFIVREHQLNTRDLQNAEGSVWKVAVAPHPTVGGITYVVLYTNGLEPFRRRPLVPTA